MDNGDFLSFALSDKWYIFPANVTLVPRPTFGPRAMYYFPSHPIACKLYCGNDLLLKTSCNLWMNLLGPKSRAQFGAFSKNNTGPRPMNKECQHWICQKI